MWVVGIVGQHVVRGLAALSFADDEKMFRVVEVFSPSIEDGQSARVRLLAQRARPLKP
jgi:hypothetical protein